MLARPSLTNAVVNQITSVVFYNEPRNETKAEVEHEVMIQGGITFINYYCCCMPVLPSHMLGMSKWSSAENYQLLASQKTKAGDILRKFRYSYYNGFMKVETHHVSIGHDDKGLFRLVEYFDCAISPWVFVYAVFGLISSMLGKSLQTISAYSYTESFILSAVFTMILLHVMLYLTGVSVWQGGTKGKTS